MAFRLFDKDKYTESFCEDILEEAFLLQKTSPKKSLKIKKEKVANDKKRY
jgi:hypothetical protein